MVSARVLCSCGSLLRFRGEQVEVRTEYRALRDQLRVRTWRVRVVCRQCAEREWAKHDGTAAPWEAPLAVTAQVSGDGSRRRIGDLRPGAPEHRPLPLSEEEAVALVLAVFPGAEPILPSAPPSALRPGTERVRRSDGSYVIRRKAGGEGPKLCGRCGGQLGQSTACERRREYRAVGTLDRLRTWQEAVLCAACAEIEWQEHDHPHGRPAEQAALL